jgi:hypothetical protein
VKPIHPTSGRGRLGSQQLERAMRQYLHDTVVGIEQPFRQTRASANFFRQETCVGVFVVRSPRPLCVLVEDVTRLVQDPSNPHVVLRIERQGGVCCKPKLDRIVHADFKHDRSFGASTIGLWAVSLDDVVELDATARLVQHVKLRRGGFARPRLSSPASSAMASAIFGGTCATGTGWTRGS